MHETYGSRKRGGGVSVALNPCGCVNIKPLEPEKVGDDQSPRCCGCPYPRHGLFCRTDAETCLRTEMRDIYNRGRRLEAAPI